MMHQQIQPIAAPALLAIPGSPAAKMETSLGEIITALQAYTDSDELVVRAVQDLLDRGVLRVPH